MNKRSIRSFAFGIIVAVSSMGAYYYLTLNNESPKESTVESALDLLTDNGYQVLTKEEFQKMKNNNIVHTKELEESNQDQITPPKSDVYIQTFKLEIKTGMRAFEIASILEKEKIIDDSIKFKTFLVKNGYSKRIQPGSFELTSEMNYKQIAKIITKS